MNINLNEKEIIDIIKYYLDEIEHDDNHRYSSWDNLRTSFLHRKQDDFHAIELAFYLASWGMYRGSSGLLQKNHKIHQQVVDLYFSNEYASLLCDENHEVEKSYSTKILKLRESLYEIYSSISFTRGAKNFQSISPTDTLITKVMLGIFGCIPAFDQYMISGMKEIGLKPVKFNQRSIDAIFEFTIQYQKLLKKCQQLIKNEKGKHYPIMKIVDIFLWQTGYNAELRKSQTEQLKSQATL